MTFLISLSHDRVLRCEKVKWQLMVRDLSDTNSCEGTQQNQKMENTRTGILFDSKATIFYEATQNYDLRAPYGEK